MKMADIKVGESYAYRLWQGAAQAEVLEKSVERREGSSWRGTTRTVKNGVLVKITDSPEKIRTKVVPSRELGPDTWQEYLKAKAVKDEHRASRARLAKRIDDHLANHGYPATQRETYEQDVLAAAGFEVEQQEGRYLPLVTARFNVDAAVRKGIFAEDVVATLVADLP